MIVSTEHKPENDCNYDEHITCFRDDCHGCQVLKSRYPAGHCKNCGTNLARWKEQMHEEHRCYVERR